MEGFTSGRKGKEKVEGVQKIYKQEGPHHPLQPGGYHVLLSRSGESVESVSVPPEALELSDEEVANPEKREKDILEAVYKTRGGAADIATTEETAPEPELAPEPSPVPESELMPPASTESVSREVPEEAVYDDMLSPLEPSPAAAEEPYTSESTPAEEPASESVVVEPTSEQGEGAASTVESDTVEPASAAKRVLPDPLRGITTAHTAGVATGVTFTTLASTGLVFMGGVLRGMFWVSGKVSKWLEKLFSLFGGKDKKEHKDKGHDHKGGHDDHGHGKKSH